MPEARDPPARPLADRPAPAVPRAAGAAPPRPARATAAGAPAAADTRPAPLAPVPRPLRPTAPPAPTRPAGAHAAARPQELPGATRPMDPFAPTRPMDPFGATRPMDAFGVTRPMDPFGVTRPMDPFAATRPMDPFAPTRPAALPPAAAPRAALPAAPAPGPGDWQLPGAPGAHLVLMPGQMHLGRQAASVRTLLGSCVAITLWHPQLRIGGMCHYLLPSRRRRAGEAADGRYGDEAVEAMVQRLRQLGAQPGEFIAHLYGGADTLASIGGSARFNVGERNIEQGWTLIERYGFQLDGVDVGEDVPRVVALTLADGAVQMRRGHGQAPDHLRG